MRKVLASSELGRNCSRFTRIVLSLVEKDILVDTRLDWGREIELVIRSSDGWRMRVKERASERMKMNDE